MFGLFRSKAEPEKIKVESPPKCDYQNAEIFVEYFKEETGISFDNQYSILKSKLTSFCRIHAISSFDECRQQVDANGELKQALINYLTTNESFFYREFAQIENLVGDVKESAAVCDILCLPSSTGEEPYSIAIALLESNISPSRFNLLGVDISSEAIQRARQGIYNKRNVSKMPSALIQKYFIQDDKSYHLNDKIKSLVRFEVSNLFSSSIQNIGRFDFILSRNMLIYFDAETKARASSYSRRATQRRFKASALRSCGSLLNFNHFKIFFTHSAVWA